MLEEGDWCMKPVKMGNITNFGTWRETRNMYAASRKCKCWWAWLVVSGYKRKTQNLSNLKMISTLTCVVSGYKRKKKPKTSLT